MLQFQEGTLFENDDKPKEKKKKKEEAISSDDQISFVLMGYPFVLADPDEIKEIKKLVDEFSNSDLEIRCETTFKVFEVIKQALKEAVEVNPDDMGIETDRM
jgi:ABC-type lipopolysaccharide export system ATPase subunit